MSNYFDNISDTLKEYFNILSDEIPDFLYDYIETPEMQKQAGISVTCGTIYSKMYNQMKMIYQNLVSKIKKGLKNLCIQ